MKALTIFEFLRCNRQAVAFVAAAVLLVGCGDGDDDSGAESGSGGGSVTLSMSGSPPSQAAVGTIYSYTPTVSNPNNAVLSFSATNLPGWLSLNSVSGNISGTPAAGDIGPYSGIRLTVSGGGTQVQSPAYSIEVVAQGSNSAILSWDLPSTRIDGTQLNGELAAIRVHWGLTPSDLPNTAVLGPTSTSYTVNGLSDGTWYFGVTAVDSEDNESPMSEVGSKTVF